MEPIESNLIFTDELSQFVTTELVDGAYKQLMYLDFNETTDNNGNNVIGLSPKVMNAQLATHQFCIDLQKKSYRSNRYEFYMS